MRAIVDAAVRPVIAEYDLPGLAVAVTARGRTQVYNYGLASKEGKLPVTDQTLFELGSVSKPMTSTLATYAVALGKLSLDERPGKYMPQLKGSAIDKATVLHLGTYTAGGLPQQFPADAAALGMTRYFKEWRPDAEPGKLRRYSNPSLGLFGHLAALALDGDFATLMEERLFMPLGMKNTHIGIPANARQHYAWGYDDDGKAVRMRPDILSAQSGGALSTAADVMRFVQANMAPQQLSGPLRSAVEGTQVPYFGVGAMRQGLGWEQYSYPVALRDLIAGNSAEVRQRANAVLPIAAPAKGEAVLFNKTGSTRGFSNYVAFVPAKKIGVVMLSNGGLPIEARIAAAHAILVQLDKQGQASRQ